MKILLKEFNVFVLDYLYGNFLIIRVVYFVCVYVKVWYLYRIDI